MVPNRFNGNTLSAEGFQDNLRLRYNFTPLDIPKNCNGYGTKMTVEHAMPCKCSGLTHARYDDAGDRCCHLG